MSAHAAHAHQAAHTEPRADRDGRPVPRWAEVAARLVPLVTLPSALWRLGLVLGFSMGGLDATGAAADVKGWENPAWEVLLVAAYLPLLAWAPLLAAVTYAYHRRRCRD